MPGDCPASLPLPLFVCGKHSAPSRTPFRRTAKTVRLPTGIGVHLQTGMLFGVTTESCSASQRNRVHLRPDSPMGVGFAEALLEECHYVGNFFRSECCSESQRNRVRLHSGIAFTFDRIPQWVWVLPKRFWRNVIMWGFSSDRNVVRSHNGIVFGFTAESRSPSTGFPNGCGFCRSASGGMSLCGDFL